MTKSALITGVTGQDGYYLARHLLGLGYSVYGLVRPGSRNVADLEGDLEEVRLLTADIRDSAAVSDAVDAADPSEVYHLAAVGLGPQAFANLAQTADVNCGGAANLMEAVRTRAPTARVFYASSSEAYAGLGSFPPYARTLRYAREARTAPPRRMGSTLHRSHANREACSYRLGSCSATSLRGELRNSSSESLHSPQHEPRWESGLM